MSDRYPTYHKWSRRTGGVKVCTACRHRHKPTAKLDGKTVRVKLCVKCGADLPANLTYPAKAKRRWFVRESAPVTGKVTDHPCHSSEAADELIRKKLRDDTAPDPVREELMAYVGRLIRQIDADTVGTATDELITMLGGDPAPRALKSVDWDTAVQVVCGELLDTGHAKVYVDNMVRTLADFRTIVGIDRFGAIDLDAIARYRSVRLAGGWQRNGRTARAVGGRAVNGDLRTLSAFLTRAVRKGWIAVNPLKGAVDKHVKVSRIRVEYLPDADLRRIIDAADETWLRALIIMAYYTGARRSDLLALEWESDIDLDGSRVAHEGLTGPHVYIRGSKADTPHWLPLHPVAVQALESLRHEPTVDRKVFPVRESTNPGPYVGGRFAKLCVKAGLTEAVERDGGTVVKNRWTLHDLRRKANTDLRNRGASPKERQELLGHRTQAVNEGHYEAILPQRGRELIDGLPAFGLAG